MVNAEERPLAHALPIREFNLMELLSSYDDSFSDGDSFSPFKTNKVASFEGRIATNRLVGTLSRFEASFLLEQTTYDTWGEYRTIGFFPDKSVAKISKGKYIVKNGVCQQFMEAIATFDPSGHSTPGSDKGIIDGLSDVIEEETNKWIAGPQSSNYYSGRGLVLEQKYLMSAFIAQNPDNTFCLWYYIFENNPQTFIPNQNKLITKTLIYARLDFTKSAITIIETVDFRQKMENHVSLEVGNLGGAVHICISNATISPLTTQFRVQNNIAK